MNWTPDPCAVCGAPATDQHHTTPRGRSGGTGLPPDAAAGEEPILAPVCRSCHEYLEPSGSWRVDREGDYWLVTDVQNGDEICRRPYEGGQPKALAVLESTASLIDHRQNKEHLLALVGLATDDELRGFDEWCTRMGKQSAFGRMVVHWQAWVRYPWKLAPSWSEDLAKSFGVAPSTIYEDVQVGRMFAEDTGPPIEASWYRVACHADDPKAALARAHELRGEGGSIQDFRNELRGEKAAPEMHECPDCGASHRIKGA